MTKPKDPEFPVCEANMSGASCLSIFLTVDVWEKLKRLCLDWP